MFINIDRTKRPQKPVLHLAKPNMQVVSRLSEASEITLDTKLGDLNELTFTIPYKVDFNHQLIDNPNTSLVRERFLTKVKVGAHKEWFMIKAITDDGNDIDKMTVSAISLGYELAGKVIREYSVESYSPRQVFADVLSGTGWYISEMSLELEKLFRAYDFSSTTALDAVIQIAQTLNAVLVWDTENREIKLYKAEEIGKNRGFTINYGKYLNTISRERTTDEMVTRLKVYGSEGLPINSVSPTGVGYLEDFSFFMYPFERDAKKKVISSSHYMSDELCHAILDLNEKIEKNKVEVKRLIDQRSSEAVLVAEQETQVTLAEGQLNITLDKLDMAKASENKKLIGELTDEKKTKAQSLRTQQIILRSYQQRLNQADDALYEMRDSLSLESNFKPYLIEERNLYIIEKEWSEERITDPEELYQAGREAFKTLREPTMVINIDIVNLLEIVDEQHNWDKVRLGDKVRISYPQMGINTLATIIGVNYNFESASISLTIANVTNIETDEDKLIKLLYQSSHASATVENNKSKWNQVKDVSKDVQSLLSSEWDATKQQINAGVNNSVTIGNRGIIIRNPDYPNDVLVAQSGVLALSRDNGETWKTAIKPTGIVAERIIGQIIAGENLDMVNEAGTFKFDKNGVEIDAKAFKVRTGDKTVNLVEKWTSANDFFEEFTNDGVLSAYEKSRTKEEWDKIAENYKNLNAQAVKMWVEASKRPIELKALEQKYTELNRYLFVEKQGAKPLLDTSNMSVATNIDRQTFNSKFRAYYIAEEQLRNKLLDKLQENITEVSFEVGDDKIVAKVTNSKAFKDMVEHADSLARQLREAQQKITDDAIVSTVTKSTQFKNKADAKDVYSKDDVHFLSSNNMLHDTEFDNGLGKWTTTNDANRIVDVDRNIKFEGSNSIKVSAKNQATNSFTTANSEWVDCKEGQQYTASVYQYVEKYDLDAGGKIAIQYYAGDTYLSETQQDYQSIDNKKWKRISVTGTTPTKATRIRVTLSVRKNGTMWFARPMLQIGRIITSWTPHVDELATELNSMIEQVAGKISLVVTEKNQINGEAITSQIIQTARAIEMLSEKINLKGKVSFDSFDSNLKKTFNADGTFNLTRATGQLDEKFIKDADRWNKASGDATKATDKLLEMIRDDKLTPTEKQTIKRELEVLQAERVNIVANADYYKITTEKTRYEESLTALANYLAPILKDMANTSDIAGDTLRGQFKNVYDKKAYLQKTISNKAKELADNAQGKANEAQNKASNALKELNEMADDNVITPYEKLGIRKELQEITAEKPTLEVQANQYGISAEKTAFVNAYNALDAYLKPILFPVVPASVINGGEFRSKFSNYYDNKIKLMRAISEKIKASADDAKKRADDANKSAGEIRNDLKNMKLDVVEKGKKWDAGYERVDQWTAQGTTEIDGGKVKAYSVIANKMAIGNWDNLFTNGTLEFGNQNFVGSNFEIINDPANAHQGNHYLRIKWNGQFNDIYDSTPLKVIEGEQYFLEGQARLLSGSDTTRTFIVQILDKSAKVINHYIGNATLNTTWKEISHRMTVPKGGVAMRIGISVGGEKNANNYTMFDSLFCKRMSEGKLIVDGSILAKHIKANELEVGDNVKVADGSIQARHIKTDELEVGRNIKMGANAVISWDKVSNKPTPQQLGALPANTPKVTKIDNNGVYTGTVRADQVTGNEISGKTIKTSNTNEHLHMENQVMRFVNQGSAKIVMGFEDERKSKTRNPYIILGEGDGSGRNIGSIYKDGNGAYYRYVDYNGAESNIRLTNAGNIGVTAQDGIWFTANRVNFTCPVSTSGILFNSFGKTPASQQGVLWVGNGYRGFGAYLHDGRAWTFVSTTV